MLQVQRKQQTLTITVNLDDTKTGEMHGIMNGSVGS
jgi:hypothetical protein